MIHRRIAEVAARRPEAPAVVARGEWLSYRELARRARALALHLRGLGVGPEDRVGVAMERTVDLVAALLGVLESGGAYLPLDPAYPAERLSFMLEDGGARVVLLGGREGLGAAAVASSAAACGARRLDLGGDGGWPALPDGAPLDPAPFGPDPGNLAYLIYTSGSTGRPKGVAIEHRSAGALLEWALGEFSAEELAGTLAATSVCFDLSVFELFVTLAAGGTVVLAEDALELPRLPADPPVTLVNTVPSAMAELVAGGGVPDSVVTVNLAGEALRRPLVDAVYSGTRARRVLNLYGPSEDTTYSTWDGVVRGVVDAPSIGRPVPGTHARLLDPAGRAVPDGEPGDLHLGGAGLARGYLGRPSLTAERFVPDPAGGGPGERLYRTGDLVRRLPDGRLHYEGRIDHQVKVRGFRIELGEVETALLADPSVHEAVAVAREGAGGKVLVAYVAGAGRSAAPAPDGEALREHLGRSLPAHMVPSRFVVLPALPRTPNGKVDRNALPEPGGEPEGQGGEPPATEVEARLAELWREVLGVDAVGRSSHFVHLGGHSLVATRLLSRVRDAYGVELEMADLFSAPTLAGFAARVEAARGSAPVLPELRPRPEGERTVAASYAQQRLWVLDRLQPGLATYNLPSAFRLAGFLDRVALARALAEVVRRHEALRTRFVEVDGRPFQRIGPPPAPPLPRVDLSALPGERREAELARLAGAEARRPFDLARGPVVRAALVAVAPGGDDHLLLLTLHHVVADAWSQGVLNRELSTLYEAFAAGRPSPLPPLPVQYADFALWQRAWPPRVLDGQLEHWRRHLAGAAPLELPSDRGRPAVQSFRGASVRFTVPPEPAAGVERLARGEGATPFMAWLALFLAVLRRHAGSDDLVVGTPVANRRRSELEALVGFFVNLLPLRLEAAGTPSFREHLAQVRGEALAAFDHQDLPFERLVAELRPERDLSRNPLCQVAFQLLDRPVPRPELPGLTVRRIDPPFETTRFDLALTLTRAEGRLTGEIELARDLFDLTTVARLAEHLLTLAAHVAARGADRPVDELPLLTRAERHALSLEPEGARALDPAVAEPVHLRVLRRAAETPDALAVAGGAGEHLTLGELARRSGHLAGVLRRLLTAGGHGPGTPVALCLERSPDFVAAALAALRAGASYLPLDSAYPAERLAFMAADAAAPVAVCRPATAAVLAAPGREVLVLEPGGFPAAEAAPTCDDGASNLGGDPLAYVIYTSGSTGRPKGVGVGHRALSNLVAWHLGAFALSARDRTTQLAQVGFDASVWEVWPALAAGAPLLLPPEAVRAAPEALRDWLVARGITIAFAPTPLAEALVALPWPAGTALRTLLTGGDRLHAPPPPGLPYTLVNDYGPTENAVVATSASIPPPARTDQAAAAPSIGRAIDGVRVHVLDPGLRTLPLGVPGELCLAGGSLARGYLHRPALTAERFVPDPLASGAPGARLYRTGDLARRLPDGSFEFLGRADRQVKVRGFRIEPGEIEAVLARQPGVRAAAVAVPAAASGARRLVAFVVAADGPDGAPAAPVEVQELRAALARELPDYMVPSLLVPLAALPTTPSGKVDRRALAERAAREIDEAGRGGEDASLANETEELLAGIWRRVLAVEAVGRGDDFFHLGGHSLLAAQVVSRVRDDLGVEVPLRALFTEPTLAGLARVVETERRARLERALPPLVPVARGPRSPLSSAQQRLWFLARLDPDDPTYNIPTAFRLRGPLDRPALAWSLGEVVRRHETLRTRFGETEDGPYQEVLAPAPAAPPVADLSGLPAERREAEATRLARAGAWRPFDLASGSLLRSLLVALSGGERPEHLLLLVMHHVASDGWSQAILHRELSALYRTRRPGGPALPEPPVQYADFALWQRGWLRGARIERQLAYWKEQLAGAPAVLELPSDRPRPAVRSHRGAELPVVLPAARVAPLRALARERGVTLFMTLLAGFQALLARLTGRRDVLVGSVVANRNHSEIEELIGFFVNALVMRGDLNPEGGREPSFDELLRRARRTALDAYAHQDLPFERLVDELRPERSLSHQPLIQVMFGLQNVPLPPLDLPGVAAEEAGVAGAVARFDLTLALFDDGAGLHGVFEYATDLFDRATVARLSGHLEALLAGAAEDPGRSVALLPLLTPAERHQAVVEWNDTRRASRLGTTIHGRFREQVARRPGAVAAVWRGRELTYGELGERSARLARFLAGLGVGRGTPVGIWMERSLDMVTAVLGVLEAGGCYLPLDAGWPGERVEAILASHAAPVLLTRSERLSASLHLRWRLERLADVACLDVETPEPPPEPLDREGVLALWDFVAERAIDRVSAAGFVSSFTGEPFSEAEVDEYRDRVVALAEPYLAAADGGARVLEVGCGSGLILERLAPRAARYVGVDPSARTQEQNREAARRRLAGGEDPGVDPECDLPVGFAHELDEVPAADGPFDLVILASTVQFFPGPLYLERVLDLALSRLAPGGAVLVADVMDARRRAELEAAIAAHATGSGGDGPGPHSTQGQELFLDEAQFGDFAASRASVARADVVYRTEGFDNELGYRYDVVLVRGERDGAPERQDRPDRPDRGAHPERSRRLWTGWHVDRLDPAQRAARLAATGPDDLAYVIHTSGSTGAPKGIAVQHRPVVHLIEWIHRTFGVGPADRLLFVTSLCFDLSVYDLFGTLAAGGTIHVASEEELEEPAALVRLLADGGITIWDSAPAALQRLAPLFPEPPAARSPLRLALLSGDWIPVALPDRVRRAFPACRVVSLGGATEATIWSNWYPVGRVDPGWPSIPYGRPIDDARYHVLDRSLEPLPAGVPGDLFIGGEVLCVGYSERPALTAERFVPDPFSRRPDEAGARLYRTGDRASHFTDGNLEFLGRVDHQVKVRGFRIELGEIEVTLERHPAVREAVVLALPAPGGDRRLVGYVVPAPGATAAAAELREHLRRSLPEYMVPADVVSLAAMPVTPNGKLDRKALAELEPAAGEPGRGAADAGAPAGPTEELVAGVWREVLEVEAPGRRDNFFALGGNSLLATQVVARLRARFGVEVPLRALFQRPTLAELAAEVEAARGGLERAEVPPLVPVSPEELGGPPPLSFSQLRLWFLVQVEPESGDYNLPLTLRWTGPLAPAVLARALAAVVRRHEVLRTAFVARRGRPEPVVRRRAAPALPVVDLAALPASSREAEVRRLVAEDVREPFDLARAPLLRAALLRLGVAEHLLRITVHHIVFDGWSLGILTRELAHLYRDLAAGRPPGLDPLPVQYGDYAAWQHRVLGGARLDDQLAFWRSRLAGAPPMLVLPTDRPRPAVQSYRGGSVTFTLPSALGGRLRALAAREGVTLFMVLLAAFDALLLRVTGQDDLSVGTFVANRRWREIEPLIGFFVNTLVLRSDLSGGPTFRDLLARVRETTLAAFEHQELPFERLLEALDPERDLSRTPLFQVMFGLQNFAVPRLEWSDDGGTVEAVDLFEEGRTNADLALWMWEEDGDRLRGWLQFNGDLFDCTTARRLIGHLESLLAGLAAAPDARLSELPLLAAGARHQVVTEWAGEARSLASGPRHEAPTVLERFHARAAERPDATAVVAGARAVSFGALARRVASVARWLSGAGAAPETVVAVCRERSPEQIATLLAVQAAGAAYLPVDPKTPAERLATIVRDAGVSLLVVDAGDVGRLEAALAGTPVRVVALPRSGDAPPPDPRLPPPDPDSRAYVIYTSGSTGTPKGVQVSHRALAAFATAAVDAYALMPDDRVLQFASAAFDASVEEIFTTLAAGSTMVLRDEAMLESPARFLELCGAHRLTVTDLPTAFWHALATYLDRDRQGRDARGGRAAVPAALRLVIIGGEAASPEAVAAWLRAVGRRPALVNTYGPSEATVVATAATLDGAGGTGHGGSAPIGRSFAGVRSHVLDAALRPVPAGVAGELVLGGPSLARGYLGRPALTAERFVPSPVAGRPGARLYRTGDLARRRPDGVLDFLGRRDEQVKIRGFRVEPGEIAAELCRHPAVREAVVVLRTPEGGGEAAARLAAYFTGDEPPPDAGELREHLRHTLPAYMVPADYVHLSALPVTPHGKVDHRALPAPAPADETTAAPPTNPTEEVIARAWCELLGLPRVGIYDDFFDLGGHSLLAPQLIARLEESFDVTLPLPVLFQAPTVAELAVAVERHLLAQIEELSDEEIERRLEGETSVAGAL